MRIHGKSGQVLMDETGSSPYTPTALADVSAFTINLTSERVPVTCFGDTNIVKVTGLPDFSGTLNGFWNSSTSPRMFDVVLAGLPVDLRLVPSTNEATYYFEGLANIDGTLEVSATGAVTFSGAWDAADNWIMAP